ncbi:MAG: hypothetical protein KDG55_12865, partial [Rhodocyclaceae bacterium]|nr:hypothetical protein [Rhodocyclaceae bacterium]
GIFGSEGVDLRVRVEPPFWRARWFTTSILVLITLLVSGAVHHNGLLRAEIRQRREAEQRRDAAEARLREATRAEALGLVHELSADEAGLDARIDDLVAALLEGGPRAQAAAKSLIVAVTPEPIGAAVVEDTARRIAGLRATPEAKEGLGAFLDKRPASWVGAA